MMFILRIRFRHASEMQLLWSKATRWPPQRIATLVVELVRGADHDAFPTYVGEFVRSIDRGFITKKEA